MRQWARDNGKSVCQRTVRQETTKYKAGTLPLNMYERKQLIGEKIQFETPSADDLDENQLDEFSDGSDSSYLETDIEDGIENLFRKKHYH